MEIVYGGTGSLTIRLDNGRELTLAEILGMDKALTLTRTSREWNRKRVVELESILENSGAEVRRYTDGEVASLQASEAELVAGPLQARIVELETELTRRAGIIKRLENKVEADLYRTEPTDVTGPLQARINDLEDRLVKRRVEINELERQVKAYDEDRESERDRADRAVRDKVECWKKVAELKTELANMRTQRDSLVAERDRLADNYRVHTEVHAQSLAARDRLLEDATKKIEAARVLLKDPKVITALNRAVRDQQESRYMAEAIEKALDTLA